MTIPNVSFSYWSNNNNINKNKKSQDSKEKPEAGKGTPKDKKELSGTQGLFLAEIENLQKNRQQKNQT